jgi:hypothetical protein
MIPHRMMPERIKKMVHCGHSSPSLHDFSIAAMFLADFKEHVAVIFGAPKCPIDVFGQISQIPYIFIGSDVKVSSPATKHYTELTEEVIAGIDNNSAQYYIIERISRLDLLAQLKAPRVILSFDRQPVEALLLAAPTALCYPTKMAVGTIRAKAILTPPFGERGKLRPFVYAATGERRRFDAGEIQEKLFYYDVCMRGYGNHRVKYNVSWLDHCGDCAIFTYACDYAGIKVSEKFINSLDPFFGKDLLSHITNKYDTVEEVYTDLTKRVYTYIYSKITLDSMREVRMTSEHAWWYYTTRKLLEEIYGDKADEIVRAIIFGSQVGYHVASLDNLYYLLLSTGLEADAGSIIKNSFRLPVIEVKISEEPDGIKYNNMLIKRPEYFSELTNEEYAMAFLSYPHSRPTHYDDPKFINMVKECMKKYNCANLHVVSYIKPVRITNIKATHYHLAAGDTIPVKFPENTMVIFISHEINKSIKILYNNIWAVNKIPCITINYWSGGGRHSLRWLYASTGKKSLSYDLESKNILGNSSSFPIEMVFNIIDPTFISTILSI